MPEEIDELERRIKQLEIERAALTKETDDASKERLAALEQELADVQEESNGLQAHWNLEKEEIGRIRSIKQQTEEARAEAERAERSGDLERAAEITYGTLPDLERSLVERQQELEKLQANKKMLKEEVDEEDVAEVVSRWTGVPVARLMEGEVEKLIRLEDHLHRRVVGQDAGGYRRRQRHPSQPSRLVGPTTTHRILHLPGPDRGRKDRAGQGPGLVHVRR